MIRKLILPAVAIALLGGCVTGYSYRQGSGDYYYGAPTVEYRYYPTYPYGYYGYYGPYRYADPYSYWYRGYPYGYRGYGYPYGYPYSHYYYRRPLRQTDTTPDGDTSPWRRLDEVRRRQEPRPQVDPVDRPPGDEDSSRRREDDVVRLRPPRPRVDPVDRVSGDEGARGRSGDEVVRRRQEPRAVPRVDAIPDAARVSPTPAPRSPSGGGKPKARQEREPSREDGR